MTKRIFIPLFATAFLALPACSDAAEPAPEATEAAPAEAPATIVDIAVGNPDFSTLVAAVTAAGLVETLSGEGPFTVFAPVNTAFDALPEGTVETLTTTETEALGGILTYHVVAGNIMAADLLGAIEGAGDDGYAVTTVNGATFTARVVDGAVQLTDAAGNVATVTATDVPASNGVIHVIDTVLMPN
jgi:uncharacterized surface protein with fasciclin (FAS1) repeats